MSPNLRTGPRTTALLAVALLSACATAPGPPSTPGGSAAAPGPARPGAGGAVLEAEVQPLLQPVVIDEIPDGLILRELHYNPPAPEYPPSRATLYGDPAVADTLDGPVLLVGTSSGSAFLGGPPEGRPGDGVVDLGNREGWLVHEADRTWVGMDGDGQDHVEFVVGRGIDEDALIAAAAGADFSAPTATLAPGAVPDGLAPLIAGSPADGPFAGPAGERFTLAGESGTVVVSAVHADPRLAALWGFWTDDAAGTVVRGQPGSMGDMHGIYLGDDARGYVWAENGMVLSVIGLGDGDRFLDQVVGGLRLGTDAELQALRRGGLERVPSARDIGCREGTPIVSGVDGDLRWGVGVEAAAHGDDRWSSCLRVIRLDGAPNASTGSFELPPVGELGSTAVSLGPQPPSTVDTLVGGVAPPGTARVTVSLPDGRAVDALLAEPGPRPGEKIFGAFLRGVQGGQDVVLTAYDAAGTILDGSP